MWKNDIGTGKYKPKKRLPQEVQAWSSLFDCGGNSGEKIQITGERRNKQEEKDKREKSAALQRELGWGRMLISVKAGNTEKAHQKKFIQYNSQLTLVFDLFRPIPEKASFLKTLGWTCEWFPAKLVQSPYMVQVLKHSKQLNNQESCEIFNYYSPCCMKTS